MRIPDFEHDPDGKYFVLMLEYFDKFKTETPTDCYALYNGNYHSMDILVTQSDYGGDIFEQPEYSMMFRLNFNPPSSCQPYAFICKTSNDNYYRLPEDENYYFGTEWLDNSWVDSCKENHYYFHYDDANLTKNGWIANGGPTLFTDDIWYYHQGNECIGCKYIDILECWQQCILSEFLPSKCNCSLSPTVKQKYNFVNIFFHTFFICLPFDLI